MLDAILCNNAGLQAAMASIKINHAATGMHNNFEASATHLLPYDPVQKKRVNQAGGKRGSASAAEAGAVAPPATGLLPSIKSILSHVQATKIGP